MTLPNGKSGGMSSSHRERSTSPGLQEPERESGRVLPDATSPAVTYSFRDSPPEDDACELTEILPLVPPGEYEAYFDRWQTVALFGGKSKKVILWFALATPGVMGTRLPRYYNVKELKGKPRLMGQFKVGQKSTFARDYCRLLGPPRRRGLFSVSRFENKIFRVRVRTVERGSDQSKIAHCLQYSVIGELLRLQQ